MVQIERIAATEPETLPVAGSGALGSAAETGRKALEVSSVICDMMCTVAIGNRALSQFAPCMVNQLCGLQSDGPECEPEREGCVKC